MMFGDEKKKSGFEKTMDGLLEGTVKAMNGLFQSVEQEAFGKINEADSMITSSLEAMKRGEEELPDHIETGPTDKLPDFDAHSRSWDKLMDGIVEDQLGAYKVCPGCHEAVSSENKFCPLCGTKLPDLPASKVVCPECGAVNKVMDFYCTSCGKPLSHSSTENHSDSDKV